MARQGSLQAQRAPALDRARAADARRGLPLSGVRWELPRAERADVRCVYCDTTNLVPKELHGAQAQALFEQAEAARHALRALNVATISIARTMRRTLIVCGVVSVLVAYGVPALVQALA